MEAILHEDKTFENVVYTSQTIRGREFQSCTFNKCDFSDSQFLNNKFLDCIFTDCNLSTMKLGGSSLSNAAFINCKILGVNFGECNDFMFSVAFDNCLLDYSAFMGKKMPKTKFNRTSLKEVSFTQANLAGSIFHETDLFNAVFIRTDLSSANLITAYNYSIDPEQNNLRKASFSVQGIHGLLDKYQVKIV